MPSRQVPQPSLPPLRPPLNHHKSRLVPPLAGGVAAAFSVLLVLTLCVRKFSRKRTVPSSDSESKPPHRFSYSSLRRATSSFAPSNRLGQGGFGSVFSGVLPNRQEIAVKLMDSGSLQGEREFQNEVFLAGKINSNYVLSLLGFSSDPKRRRMLLVYELMTNGSLQDCLLHRKCEELKDWKKRFSIALDIAKGLENLHHYCDPPIIHGDIKPSNILLDRNFNAKIGDFGLARLKSEDHCEIDVKKDCTVEDNGSVVAETESVMTGTATCDEFHIGVDNSPDSALRVRVAETSPETTVGVGASPETFEGPVVSPRMVAAMASPTEGLEKSSLSDGNFDRATSIGSEGGGGGRRSRRKKSVSGADWWWKQETGGADSGKVKDYVMEWIGSEIKKERPNSEWIGVASSSGTIGKTENKKKKKKNSKRLDWWVSLDDDKSIKREKRRPAREWWKEEYCEELAKKKKKKKKQGEGSVSDDVNSESWWPRDEEMYIDRKKKSKSRSRSSRSSVDWWKEGLSGEFWRGRRNSFDSGEIPKSYGGVSSTPSMRGTVCYVAPEYGGGGDLSEKCDVYSYGVLLLVIVAGRRPLQVTGSPMSEFRRANLLSWARHLARGGKLLDLVDKSLHGLDKEQAVVCITVALLCLQKCPARRPSMKEVVGMLCGDLDPPQLPLEFSPSPPSGFPFKSRKKIREERSKQS